MTLKVVILASLLIIVFIFISSSLLWAEDPGQIIVKTVDSGLEVLKDPSLQNVEKISERKQKLWEILEPIFNFEEISKRALGRHWKDCTVEERKKFTKIFTEILKNVYLNKSDSYMGEKIVYLREDLQSSRCKVQTNFITTEEKKIAVDFSMRKFNDTWKIYDVTIEGVSIVGNYRSQFNSILSKSSFDELLQKLKEKEKKFN